MYMRNYSVSPIIREIQIKSLLCSHSPQIGWPLLKKKTKVRNSGVDVEKEEFIHIWLKCI